MLANFAETVLGVVYLTGLILAIAVTVYYFLPSHRNFKRVMVAMVVAIISFIGCYNGRAGYWTQDAWQWFVNNITTAIAVVATMVVIGFVVHYTVRGVHWMLQLLRS